MSWLPLVSKVPPADDSVTGRAAVKLAIACTVPPARPSVVPASPKALSEPTWTTPPPTVVPPAKLLLPPSVTVPGPSSSRPPLPLMSPAKATSSERLKASTPLFSTLPAIMPVVPPSPSCRVPPEMIVPPP